MKLITYVNMRGEPVDPNQLPRATPAPAKTSLKRVRSRDSATQHHGFEVVGVSQERMDLARQEFEALNKGRQFDADAWLARQKPRRAIKRVFEIPAAADQAAGMLLAGGGWHRVAVVEILKG